MGDVFHRKYRTLSDEESASVDALKTKAEALYEQIGLVGGVTKNTRYAALAKTALEEAVMWATKAVTE